MPASGHPRHTRHTRENQETVQGQGHRWHIWRPASTKGIAPEAAFEKRLHAHQSELQEKKATKSNSYTDRAYHKFMQEMLPLETDGATCERFQRMAQKWKSEK